MKTILVPIDFSPATSHVTAAACVLAQHHNAKLIFLHVLQSLPFLMNDYYGYDASLLGEIIAKNEQAVARKLKTLAEKCRRSVPDVRTFQQSGRPVTAILQHAEELKADYIVLGSHGHSALFDLLLGSTAQGVLRKAPCPVLVVPTTRPKAKRKS